jgi:ABC-2 type transport system ATP-binding protein
MSSETIISVKNLSREFGSRKALSAVSVDVPRGSVVGLLGPNGCGKTTLIKHLIGLLVPSHGRVEVFGTEARDLTADHVARIGYVSQEPELLPWLNVGETVDFARAHQPRWDDALADRLLGEFGLERRTNVGKLSGGQKQRVAIVLGVSHRPELLLLDEPAASLDPIVRQEFLDLLMELIQDGDRTILISSHILTDVEKVIDRVLILDRGHVHCFQPLDDLREEYYRIDLNALEGELPAEIALTGLKHLARERGRALATVHNPDRAALDRELAGLACAAQVRHLEFEEIYRLVVTGK